MNEMGMLKTKAKEVPPLPPYGHATLLIFIAIFRPWIFKNAKIGITLYYPLILHAC